MKFDKWLIINSRGTARVTKNKPALEADGIAVRLLMQIPDQLFWRPTIEAQIVIPPDSGPPPKLDATVVGQVGDAMKAAGLQVVLSVREPVDD